MGNDTTYELDALDRRLIDVPHEDAAEVVALLWAFRDDALTPADMDADGWDDMDAHERVDYLARKRGRDSSDALDYVRQIRGRTGAWTTLTTN